jgi:hypothetical protein
MGVKNTKLIEANEFRKEKYEQAYTLLGEKLYTIPIKYVVDKLKHSHWSIYNIVAVLSYIRDYTLIVFEDKERIIEIDSWIDGLLIERLREQRNKHIDIDFNETNSKNYQVV